MAKRKRETMLQRQRRLLQMQRAKNAANKKLPPKGETKAGSVKARVQRATTAGNRRDAVARKNLETVAKGVKRMIRQSSAQGKLDKAAKGTKGSGTRTGQVGKGKIVRSPGGKVTSKGGDIVKSSKGKAVDGRIERVKVRVEPQKRLPPGKTKVVSGSSPKGNLPPGKTKAISGSSPKGSLPQGKTRPTGRPSARRAQAAARAARAAQGSKGTEVRLDVRGQKAANAEAAAKASKSVKDAAVKRAVQATRSSKLPGRLSGAATAATLLEQGLALLPGPTGREVRKNLRKSDEARDLAYKTAREELGKLGERTGAIDKKKPAKPKTESKGKVKVQTSNATRTIKKSRDYQAEAKAKPKVEPPKAPKVEPPKAPKDTTPPAGKVPAPKPKPIPKPTPKSRAYAADSRNKEYDRLRKAGKLKEAAALGKKIHADKFGKKDKKKKPQSAAMKAGYPGNRNY